MTRMMLTSTLAMALGCGLAFAQDQSAAPATPAAPAPASAPAAKPIEKHHGKHVMAMSTKKFSGKVDALDAAAKTLTVKNKKGKSMTFSWNESTKVKPSMDALKAGANVSVEAGNDGVATTVSVKSAK